MERALYIGLDAGGSKTKVLASLGPNMRTEELVGPGSNPSRLGSEESTRILCDLLDQVISKSGGKFDRISAHLGIAGIGGINASDSLRENIIRHLKRKHGALFLDLHILSDIELNAKSDLAPQGGCSLILGTGSSFICMDQNGELHQGGGWGFLLGDEGSGFAISIAALKHAMTCIDRADLDAFSKGILDHIDCAKRSDLINYVYAQENKIQEICRWVVNKSDNGSEIAESIIVSEHTKLISELESFIQANSINLAPRIVLNGGMAASKEIRRCFNLALASSTLHPYELTISKLEPARGAVLLSFPSK